MTTEAYYLMVTYIMAGIVGLCVGSFLNVAIYRLPLGMNLLWPSSHCTTCDYKLKWYDNIPVLSYIMLRGKCRSCGEHISFRYTFVEILNTLLWLLSVYLFYDAGWIKMICCAVICSILTVMFFTDLEHMIIPLETQIALLIPAVVMFFAEGDKLGKIFGFLLGGGLFVAVYLAGYLIYKKEVFGAGDVKLMAIAGLLLGWQCTLLSVLIASLSGSIVLFILKKKNRNEKMHEYPFGPFLTVAVALSFFFGRALVDMYMNLITSLVA